MVAGGGGWLGDGDSWWQGDGGGSEQIVWQEAMGGRGMGAVGGRGIRGSRRWWVSGG